MDLFDLGGGTEANSNYQKLAASNNARLYDFMLSMIEVARSPLSGLLMSESLIKAFNFHAVVGLHYTAGQYRSYELEVNGFSPPAYFRVPSLMDDFVGRVNWLWQNAETTELATYALWRLNHIHPFRNGNGRTARVLCYYIIAVKARGVLTGKPLIPEFLSVDPGRAEYVKGLEEYEKGNETPLLRLIRYLTLAQIRASTTP